MNNREIKFRAWDGQEMIVLAKAGLQYFDFEGSYVLSFVVDGYSEFWAHEQYEKASKKSNKFPIMQYTGLKDKNGVEIYEGDILKTDSTDKPLVVSWSNKFASFVIERKDWAFKHYFGESTEPEWTEVIGNIYEHPHLLLDN